MSIAVEHIKRNKILRYFCHMFTGNPSFTPFKNFFPKRYEKKNHRVVHYNTKFDRYKHAKDKYFDGALQQTWHPKG